ncbi:unnamed protein product, partial [marine sediment metagenome]
HSTIQGLVAELIIDPERKAKIAHYLEELFWDEEIVTTGKIRVWNEKKKEYVPLYNTGSPLINRVASQVIGRIIGQDLNSNPQDRLKEPVSSHTRALAVIKKIKDEVDPAELERSETSDDPLLKGFKLDELTYNEEDDAYYLPVYQEIDGKRVKALQYRFYLEGDEKTADMTFPLGDGVDVYVDAKGIGFKQSQTVDAGYVKEMCKLLWRSGGENIILKESRNFREFVLGVVRGHCANKKGISALNIGSSGGRFSNEVSEIMDSG